jgi:hypothetical protein
LNLRPLRPERSALSKLSYSPAVPFMLVRRARAVKLRLDRVCVGGMSHSALRRCGRLRQMVKLRDRDRLGGQALPTFIP